jgi:hypothetical protein
MLKRREVVVVSLTGRRMESVGDTTQINCGTEDEKWWLRPRESSNLTHGCGNECTSQGGSRERRRLSDVGCEQVDATERERETESWGVYSKGTWAMGGAHRLAEAAKLAPLHGRYRRGHAVASDVGEDSCL